MGRGLWGKIGRFFSGGAAAAQLDAVQRLLVEADFGVAATNETVERLSRAATVDAASLERIVAEQLGPPGAPLARAPAPPTVILIFGVNGTGKTTSVAKLAKRLQTEGRTVLLAAADTFRAGATEQLKIWADRLHVPFVGAAQGADSLSGERRDRRRPGAVRPCDVCPSPGRRLKLQLNSPVKFLKGVGPKRAEALQRLGIRTAGDLLYHTPHRYLDATTVTPLARAAIHQEVTCVGRVVSTGLLPTRPGLRVFRAVLKDSSGLLECAWPGRPFLERQIKKGQLLLVTGPVRYYHGKQIVPHEFIVLAEPDEGEGTGDPGLVLPVYPATEGLTHRQIRALVQQHLDELLALVSDPHPAAFRATHSLIELRRALELMHRPKQVAEAELGRRRLAFDELFDQQLVQARARHLAKRARAGIRFTLKRELTTRLKEHLPFELTADQRHAVREITDDMTAPLSMHRLLVAYVGSGKTVIALFAMLLAAENDYQAAIMAPTELLAEQHHATLTRLLEPLAIQPDLLSGRLGAGEKAAARRRLAMGASRIVVGTHALIQEAVTFHRLGLAVIDEQHRFGVEQRAALVEKGDAPDVLLLTATPIPRSLALTLYGDLDVTQIRERPPGRGAVKTAVRTDAARAKI